MQYKWKIPWAGLTGDDFGLSLCDSKISTTNHCQIIVLLHCQFIVLLQCQITALLLCQIMIMPYWPKIDQIHCLVLPDHCSDSLPDHCLVHCQIIACFNVGSLIFIARSLSCLPVHCVLQCQIIHSRSLPSLSLPDHCSAKLLMFVYCNMFIFWKVIIRAETKSTQSVLVFHLVTFISTVHVHLHVHLHVLLAL